MTTEYTALAATLIQLDQPVLIGAVPEGGYWYARATDLATVAELRKELAREWREYRQRRRQ